MLFLGCCCGAEGVDSCGQMGQHDRCSLCRPCHLTEISLAVLRFSPKAHDRPTGRQESARWFCASSASRPMTVFIVGLQPIRRLHSVVASDHGGI